MSNIALTWAQSQVTGSPISKLILFKLADQANDDGVCWPAQGTIAEHCEVSRQAVSKHLKILEEAGLLRRESRYENGRQVSSVYRLDLSLGGVNEVDTGVNEVDRGCQRGRQGGVNEVYTEPSRRTLIEPKREKRKPETEIPENFELTESMLTYCQKKAPGIDPYHQFEKFHNHHQAKGTRFRSWEAAWRTWVLNAAKWEPQQPEPPRRISLAEAAGMPELNRRHH